MSRRNRRNKPRKDPAMTVAAAGVPQFAATPERQRRGDIRVQALVEAAPVAAEQRDWTGDRQGAFPRKVVMGYVTRDRTADVRVRLLRFKDLQGPEREPLIAAAERFVRDWDLARLEPSLIANLQGAGGGQAQTAELAAAALDARDRIQAARNALRAGGEECVRVVEGITIFESPARGLGAPRYADPEKARVYVATVLSAGLNLLALHYSHGDQNGPGKAKVRQSGSLTGSPPKA